jgi:hypothetical protein
MRPGFGTGFYRHRGLLVAPSLSREWSDQIRRHGKGKARARQGTPMANSYVAYKTNIRRHSDDAPQRVKMVRDGVLDSRALSGRIIPGLVSIALGTPAFVSIFMTGLS